MKRRQLLKNLGLGGVALVATPTVLSILQSCTNEPDFTPNFLSVNHGKALRHMVDLIIPSDEVIPGAVDVGVHEFIDNYWAEVTDLEDQKPIELGFNAIETQLESITGKTFENAKAEHYDQVLAKYLRTTPEQDQTFREKLGQFYQAYQKDKTVTPDPEAGAYSLANNVRGMTIWGWKASEKIGEDVLAYEPIPGQQIGCLPVSEATGGKVYSL